MKPLKCTLCDKEYLGHDDSAAGVPNICGECDAEMFDDKEITEETAAMTAEHEIGYGEEGGVNL